MPSFQGVILGVVGNEVRVLVGNHTVQNSVAFDPSTVSAGIKALRNGNIQTGSSVFGTTPSYSNVGGGEWATPAATDVGDDYEVRMVTGTGTVSAGSDAVDTWLALTSDREWKVTQAAAGVKTFTGTLEIRKVGDVSAIDSGSISLTALVDV